MKPTYTIALETGIKSLPDAHGKILNYKVKYPGIEPRVTYYIPKDQYRSWVPNWLIRLITKPQNKFIIQ